MWMRMMWHTTDDALRTPLSPLSRWAQSRRRGSFEGLYTQERPCASPPPNVRVSAAEGNKWGAAAEARENTHCVCTVGKGLKGRGAGAARAHDVKRGGLQLRG